MPSITSLLSGKTETSIGVITAVVGDGVYRVTSGGRSRLVKDADLGLAVGDRIIFNAARDGNIFVRAAGTSSGDADVVQLDE